MPEATMQLGNPVDEHEVGDRACGECWGWYPKSCDNITREGTGVCPGLIHASFGDESSDGYWLYTKCDVCGMAE